jgi:hypothetical protein
VPLASGLEQERHVEDDDGSIADLRLSKESVPRGRDQRMHDGLQLGECGIVTKHHRGELVAVDFAVSGRPGERALDQGDRLALIERMDHGVGIVDRHTGLGKKFRRGRFTHAD